MTTKSFCYIAAALFALCVTIVNTGIGRAASRPITMERMIEIQCPNGNAIARASKLAGEAEAMLDKDRATLERAAAREYYRCSQDDETAPYARDWATVIYAAFLLSAAGNDADLDDAISIGLRVKVLMSYLGTNSRYTDVRKAAVAETKMANQLVSSVQMQQKIDALRQQINATAPPPGLIP